MANLRIPGPTPCPPDVLQSMTQQMINHRGPEFAALIERVTEGIRPFFATRHDIVLPTCSGTGVMEAAIVNTLSPGDQVLAVSIGSFGDRFGQIAEVYGAAVTRLNFEWGEAADAAVVRQALRGKKYRAVTITHNETSTAITNPLGAICAAIRAESDALLLVDAVSSMGCVPVLTDEWGLDVVVTGSQKGWQVPPGVGMVAVSPRAWQAMDEAKMPRFYLDLKKHREFYAKGQTPWTPAVPVFYALDAAVKRMTAEGPAATFARHERAGQRVRTAIKAMGLELYGDERYASNTLTAVKVPAGIDGKALNKLVREKYDTVLGGGQGKLQGLIVRIGHLGWFEEAHLSGALQALQHGLAELGYPVPGEALARA